MLTGKTRGKKGAFLIFFLAFMAINTFQIRVVFADVPSVLGIKQWASGTDTILNITVRHSSPTSSHYVNEVEVDLDGTVHDINLTSQSTVTFVVQSNMGEIAEEPTVRARAYCTIHRWSSWSNSERASGFSLNQLIPLLAIASILVIALVTVLLFRSKVRGSKERSN